jgi:hypothetical protein
MNIVSIYSIINLYSNYSNDTIPPLTDVFKKIFDADYGFEADFAYEPLIPLIQEQIEIQRASCDIRTRFEIESNEDALTFPDD